MKICGLTFLKFLWKRIEYLQFIESFSHKVPQNNQMILRHFLTVQSTNLLF